MNSLESWMSQVVGDLGISADVLDRDLLLDLARDVAHGVARPAAPLTAFLVGVAADANGADHDAVADAVAKVRKLLPASS
jgi:hypothetical protein